MLIRYVILCLNRLSDLLQCHLIPTPFNLRNQCKVLTHLKAVASNPDIEYTNRTVKEQKLKDMKAKFIEQMNEKITSARAAYTKVTE